MCTAMAYDAGGGYFGRNLDLEYSYGECVAVTPRRFPWRWRTLPAADEHYALIGAAAVAGGMPLYYDGMNERGLAMAGLSFPESAYFPAPTGTGELAPFEVIPWVLGRCATVEEARRELSRVRIARIPFSDAWPITPLHWMISNGRQSLVVEPLRDGVRLWDNPAQVLTNEPPFDVQMLGLRACAALSADPPVNRLAPELALTPFSKGMGARGLPGDFSSPSRFVRAAFARWNARCGDAEEERVAQCFHMLGMAAQPRGCNRTAEGDEITRYTSCCDLKRGIYYYAAYDTNRVIGVDMHREDLNGREPAVYPLQERVPIEIQNG